MRPDDDKRSPLPKPPGYKPPPPPSPIDVARTLDVIARDVVPTLARLAFSREIPSTATQEGLDGVRAAFGRALARAGVSLEVIHASRVPRAGGLVLMWNQESHLDHLVLPNAIPRPFISLYNNAIARTPLYGSHMRRTGHVHVDRTDEAQWRASVARAAERAQGGACVLVSPEGTRSWDGALLPMKRGAFILAAASRQPIVCVTVIGGNARLPRGSPFVRGGPIRVVFSEPIATRDAAEDRLAEIVAETFQGAKDAHRL